MKIYVAGIGPGSAEDITPAVSSALADSDIIVGYKYYFQFISRYLRPDAVCIDTGMKKEQERAKTALEYALNGHSVCVISSGDAGIYGMAPLLCEMVSKTGTDVDVTVLPGISAFQKAAALMGAPMGHDFCVLSLSDLMTPWKVIEKRIWAAATADFVTAVYNPRSNERYWQLHRLKEIFQKERNGSTPVGYVRQAGRGEQKVTMTTLSAFDPEDVDMFTIVIIGNSQSYVSGNMFVTPRGYYGKEKRTVHQQAHSVGQSIMIESFRTIKSELKNKDVPLSRLWPLLHAIHTTADFEMENLLWMDDDATEKIYQKVIDGKVNTIVTDVTMVASGIRKGALQRLGIEVVCYINDPRVVAMAAKNNITRAQAGVRIAANEHPTAIYAFGNAPTGLLELCDLVRKKKIMPAGIIGAPVGFVHVEESKHAVKTFTHIPKILIDGRKGGSNLAATLVNSILTYADAENLEPGRDV
ncbi:MAG: precorrin-3B C(17)-methyltransferase [Paludibacteraceae bacterium]|nr:precorrin-3B C(17)-methyltransferase [Paludibacteraceae bacterium]